MLDMTPRTRCGGSLAVALLLAGSAAAADWSSTNAQLLHGSGFELGLETRDILTLEHASEWKYGSNYAFVDVTEPFGDATELYGEWYTRLGLGKLAGRKPGTGLVRDVSVAASLNAGQGFRAYLAGATVHLNVPHFTFVDVDVMAYDDRSDTDVTYIVTPAWEAAFPLGAVRLCLRGFVDVIGREGERESQVLAQPQVLVDLGPLWGNEGQVMLGIEYHYWRNKFGIAGVTESAPQAMVLWRF